MIDWHKSMQQSFEFYRVDPNTWADEKPMDLILSGSVTRDEDSETRCSAEFDTSDVFEECYVRVYLIAIQNGIKHPEPLGTFLCQTPNDKYDGRIHSISVDAYSPLTELKEKGPPIGYALMSGTNIMTAASEITRQSLRAPVVPASGTAILTSDFIANLDDTWLGFISDLIAKAGYHLDLDEMGRIIFSPEQDYYSLQPRWVYDDSNSSILFPELSVSRDLYNVPNVVEVVYSTDSETLYSRVVNDSKNSPISTVNRGREIVHRETSPDLVGSPTQWQLDLYAKDLLKRLSSLEYTLTYSHGYCPVRVGDCVLLNYTRQNLVNVKAKVTRQTIKCETGCRVEETAVYTENLWE